MKYILIRLRAVDQVVDEVVLVYASYESIQVKLNEFAAAGYRKEGFQVYECGQQIAIMENPLEFRWKNY